MNTFQFLRPDFLWLIPLLFVLPFLLTKSISSSNVWEKICDKILLGYLTTNQKATRKKSNFWIYLSFLSAIIALAGPSFKQTVEPVVAKQIPLMIVLDLSSDMNRIENTLSRLSRAKIEITDILKKSKASPTGLIVYTYEPFLISPLTYDSNIIINLLPAISTDIMPIGGNKLDRALELAASKLRSNDYSQANILVLTSDIPLGFDKSLEVAQKAAAQGYKTSVYGLSAKTNEKLQKLASVGEGVYINTSFASSEKLINLFKNAQTDEYKQTENTITIPEDDGIFFVFISLFCLLFLFRANFGIFALFFMLPFYANAGFWYTADQEGALAFSSKEYDKAASKFKNDDWKAAAYYKAKNYAGALKILEGKNDTVSLYNKGNTLAKAGKINEAIQTYEEVLKKEPNNEDAKFNLEYLKNLAKQQQQQSQNNNNNNQNQTQSNNQNQTDQKNENNDRQTDDTQKDSNQNESSKANQENQNTPDENNENQDNNENQNQDNSEPDKQENEEPDENSTDQNEEQKDNENDMSAEQTQTPTMPAKEEDAPKYDETVQARTQKFRAVKEDPGGLLKAFIKQEYLKKRY